MSTHDASAAAGASRRRYGLQAAVMALAVTAIASFLLLITERTSVQLDRLATRDHVLSSRTVQLLNRLTGEHEIVVVANLGVGLADPVAAQQTLDTLDTIARASDKVSLTVIDTGKSDGLSKSDALIQQMLGRFETELADRDALIRAAAADTDALATRLGDLAERMPAVAEAFPTTMADDAAIARYLEQNASVMRVGREDLEAARDSAVELLESTRANVPVPRMQESVAALLPLLGRIGADTGTLADQLRVAESSLSTEGRRAVAPVRASLTEARDAAAVLIASLESAQPLAIERVAGVLEASSAVLVIAPPGSPGGGVAAINFERLFPPSISADDSAFRTDERHRAEQLVATALLTLSSNDAPIVVLVHGAPFRLAPEFRVIGYAVDRLLSRSMDVLEWPVALSASAPSLAAVNPEGVRPVVYVVIPSEAGTADGARRNAAVADTLAGLISSGESVMVSLLPSELAAYGQKDLMAAPLAAMGIEAMTATPLLSKVRTPAGPIVTSDLEFANDATAPPVASAVRGLRHVLTWSVPLTVESGESLLTVALPDTWAESEWLSFRSVRPSDRNAAQVQGRLRAPAPDEGTDDDVTGPWSVAVATERDGQRAIVVGSSGWFFDSVTTVALQVGTRAVPRYPGNIELFESGVYWLAGQDDLVATSEAASSIAFIPPLEPGALRAIRWVLIAGLPLLVLLVGAGWRFLRG